MSRAPISRRHLVAGAGITLAAATLPVASHEACSAVPASELMPRLFDPAAFCDELIDAGFRIDARRPVPVRCDAGRDLRPSYAAIPVSGGFGHAYRDVMQRWSDAIHACPDHVEQVVRHAFAQEAST